MTTETRTAHTPGPWRYYKQADGTRFHVTATPPGSPGSWRDDFATVEIGHEANAALIAAAPDYYAAAEAIRAHVVAAERLDDGRECHIPADMIRALLDAHRRAYTGS